MAFGERLQREREMRGITLEEIAKATRIGTRSLRALEQEDFGKLPGGIFNKGFVRAYARYLGIDEEQAVSDYLAAIGEPGDPALDGDRLKKLEAGWRPPRRSRLGIDPHFQMPWRGLLLLVGIVVLLALGWHFRNRLGLVLHSFEERRHSAVALPVAPPPVAPVESPAPAPAAPSAASDSATATAAPSKPAAVEARAAAAPASAAEANAQAETKISEPITLRIRTLQDSWISIEADGQSKAKGMMDAGKERTVTARRRVKLIAGNAAGVEIFFNGQKQPALGPANQVRIVTFTADGMQTPAGSN